MVGASVTVRRHFTARPDQVFGAFTRPELLTLWFARDGLDVATIETDVRMHGRFAFHLAGELGTRAAEGIYLEIVPDSRLVLSWTRLEGDGGNPADGITSLVTVDITPEKGGSTVSITHEGLAADRDADSYRQGWTEAFAKLARVLANEKSRVFLTV